MINHIQGTVLTLLVFSETAQWWKFYHFPNSFTKSRKIAECSKCHNRVANWTGNSLAPVCANCTPTRKTPAKSVLVVPPAPSYTPPTTRIITRNTPNLSAKK